MKNRVLHVMIADKKFTLPLVNWLIQDGGFQNHFFLILENELKNEIPKHNSFILQTPFRSSFVVNLTTVIRQITKADKIILHGLPLLEIIKFFPWKWSSTSWVIHGADLYNKIGKKESIFSFNFFFKNLNSHLTHIKGDSKLANLHFKSSVRFQYTPMYLSNVVETKYFVINQKINSFIIIVGNSLSKNNNHSEVFKKLVPHLASIEQIICPLSYGNDLDYKKNIINDGFKLFGNKFKPLTEFMTLSDYNLLLRKVDIAVFDHWRQEAMGVTLTLLSLGKTVFMRSETESFKYFRERGFKIFDNEIVFTNGPKIFDTSENKKLLESHYSLDVLKKSLLDL
jgi:hypothetical protein